MLSRKECQRIRNEYAQFISKEQMREICHLSKRSCTLLLVNHAIPCTVFQKKTHKYIVNRDDVIAFLKKNDPRDIRMMCRSFKIEEAYFTLNDENRHYLREYYEEQLAYLPEIIPTYVIAQITGYSKGYVDKWCCDEVIESMTVANKRYVQKDVLLDYLASDKYSGIIKRSKKHKESVDRFLTEYLKAHKP